MDGLPDVILLTTFLLFLKNQEVEEQPILGDDCTCGYQSPLGWTLIFTCQPDLTSREALDHIRKLSLLGEIPELIDLIEASHA